MKNITVAFVVVVLGFALVAAFMYGENKQEIVECNTWQQQVQQFKGFYLTHWQAEQCAYHHIEIAAPVQ